MQPSPPPSSLLAALVLAVAGALPALAQGPTHELVVIEPDSTYSLAMTGCSDVNDLGLVVGVTWVGGAFVHFEWTAQAGFTYPTHTPPGGERRINNRGDSVFFAGTPDLVLADGTHVPIPDPIGGWSGSGKSDLNDALTVVGQGVPSNTSSTVFHWTPSGGSQSVLVYAASRLRRVNAYGTAVGYRLFNDTDQEAFVVDVHTGAWVDLHALLPAPGLSEAFDVNDAGLVLGTGPDGTSVSAWVWSAATGFVFLPGLDGGPTMRVYPSAIDNAGRVVGSALTGAGDFHAFLWDPQTGMTDLHALYATGDFRLVEALDISENGVIIGRGFHGTAWGPDRGFILRPLVAGPGSAGGEMGDFVTTGAPPARKPKR